MDNKLICSVLYFKLRGVTAKWANPAQRGFVAGRRLMQNPVDLDAAARLHGCGSARAEKPLLAFFDLSAAFPSLAHDWICKAMAAMANRAAFRPC